jgi:adhesin transport system outer membrane protein
MNDDGKRGVDKDETIAKVELSMDFDLGMSAFGRIDAARANYAARTNKTISLEKATRRQVLDSWQQLQTAKRRAHTLGEQSKISAAFLELARKERELGNRSLLEVLAGETDLINAQSDSVAAKADILIGTLNLLDILGQLSLEQL